MSLQTRILALVQAIGADVKALTTNYNTLSTSSKDASNLTSGTVPDARFPTRLQSQLTVISNPDSAVETGWGQWSPGNALVGIGVPDGSTLALHILRRDASWIVQDGSSFNGDIKITRRRANGTWTAWVRTGTSGATVQNDAPATALGTIWYDPDETYIPGEPTNHDDRYYTESEINAFLGNKSDISHNHDGRYYTESEMDALLVAKAASGHNHDDRYFTETEANAQFAGINHAHANMLQAIFWTGSAWPARPAGVAAGLVVFKGGTTVEPPWVNGDYWEKDAS